MPNYDNSLLLNKMTSFSDWAFDSYIADLFECVDQNEVECVVFRAFKDTDLTTILYLRLNWIAKQYISSVLGLDPEPFYLPEL